MAYLKNQEISNNFLKKKGFFLDESNKSYIRVWLAFVILANACA